MSRMHSDKGARIERELVELHRGLGHRAERGNSRIIGFKGEPTPDGTPAWDIYVTPGKEQEERGSEQRESRSPTSSSRTGVQRWAPKSAAERPAADDRPFFDDNICDVGRGE
jgi:hypothetical protein